MKPENKLLLCLLVAIVALTSCKNSDERSAFADLPVDGWKYGTDITLDVPVDSLPSLWDARLVICYSEDYRYDILPIQVQYGNLTDTLNVILCRKDNKWNGRGTAARHQLTVQLDHPIMTKDTARLHITNIAGVPRVNGIDRIGVFLTKKK